MKPGNLVRIMSICDSPYLCVVLSGRVTKWCSKSVFYTVVVPDEGVKEVLYTGPDTWEVICEAG